MALLAQYSGPRKGINTSVPDSKIDPAEAASGTQNFTDYEGYIQQPSYAFHFPPGGTPDGNPILGIYTFTDSNNVYHQGVITTANLYDQVTTLSWGTAYAIPNTGGFVATFVNSQIFTNELFFVNGDQFVFYFDGITPSVQTATDLYGAKYIFELASSLCIAYTTESGGIFEQRVRWAVAGTINEWDPGTFIGAGFEDLRECPDGITGILNTNPVAYIIRSNGITQMVPTGIGTAAFNFDHLWASKNGIGDVIGSTVANFGPVGFVVSSDDIYVITASSYERIGSKIKNVLYKQIAGANFGMFGWVEPLIDIGSPYLRYRLAINTSLANGDHGSLDFWNFNTETNTWEHESIDYLTYGMTITGLPANLGPVATANVTQNNPVIPVNISKSGSVNTLLQENTPGGSASNGLVFYQGQYVFKRENDPQYRSITVRQVLVRYQYLGNDAGNGVPVSITLVGMYATATQTLNLADPAQTKAYYGGFPAPVYSGNYYIAAFSPSISGSGPLTDYEYQVQLGMASPLNGETHSIRITDVLVFGDIGKEMIR